MTGQQETATVPEQTIDTPNEADRGCCSFVGEGRLVEIIFSVCLSAVLGVIGLAANVVNIINFTKQGFSDPCNISLCALAISDVGALLPLLWRSICLNPMFQYSDIEFDSIEIEFLTAGWPHGLFIVITSWITAFITFERCVCIAVPLKVKDIITSKRTFIIIVVIFAIGTASICPIFGAFSLVPKFNPRRNKTLYEFSPKSNGLELENILLNNHIFEQISSFIIVVVCTIILIHNLRAVSHWRYKTSVHSSSHLVRASRDIKVIKMITFISCIFIFCFSPGTVNIMVSLALSPDYRINGGFENAYQISWAIVIFLETVNSSISIVVYYNMSSKYRATFNKMFGIPSSSKQLVLFVNQL